MADSGKIDELKGRARKAYGELADDDEQKRKGNIDKAAGKVKQGIESIREKASELMDSDKKNA